VVTFVYYRYIIIPLKKKHLQEQENLKLQQAELMALFTELSPDPIFRFDEKGKILLANNSAHKLFPHKILVGEQVEIILPFVKSFDLHDIILGNKVIDHTTLLGESYYQFIIDGVSKFKFCQVYGRDITELKKSERDLKDALTKADESKKLKEFFLSQISHEIRSPLNVIIGYSEILRNELSEKSSEVDNYLIPIINNSKRLYRTFDLMLNMSQLQAGKYQVRYEKVDLFNMLRNLLNEYKSYAEQKRIKLSLFSLIEGDVIVIADHYSIGQIFSNLIDNAIKYTENGSVEIKIYPENFNVCIDITDTGIGIPKEYQSKLFTPFSQADMSYTRIFDGTGLGLALVKQFIDINRAKIKVNSEYGRGSTFTVILNGDRKWGILN
jgi:signal transduction histidine kinase